MQLEHAFSIIMGSITIFGSVAVIFWLASLFQRWAQDYYDRGR